MLYSDYALVAAICGLLSSLIAKHQGRNPYGWFFIGAAGSILSLILVMFLKKKIAK